LKIDKHISDLLHHYDCVIIPDFGGFVTNYKPAQIDPSLHMLNPPSKALIFNKNLVTNDGLLADKISQFEQVSYDAANGKIVTYVKDAKSALEAGNRVQIDKVGILFYDKERNIQFVADKDMNYLLDAFGLTSFYGTPVPVEEIVEVEEVVAQVLPAKQTPLKRETKVVDRPSVKTGEVEKPVEAPKAEKAPVKVSESNSDRDDTIAGDKDEEVGSRGGFSWRFAAVATLVLMLSASGMYVYKSHSTGQTLSGQSARFLNPFDWEVAKYRPYPYFSEDQEYVAPDPHAIYVQPESVTTIEVAFTDEVQRKVVVRLHEELATTHVDQTYVDNTNTANRGLIYHVIGGCFAEKANADRLVESMRAKGYSPQIVDQKDGLYRVSFQSFGSRREAKATMKAIRESLDLKGWILKK
jgi:cell division septation protein DedD